MWMNCNKYDRGAEKAPVMENLVCHASKSSFLQTGFHMGKDLTVDVLDGAHFTLPDAVDDGPAVVFGGFAANLPAGGKIGKILLVNVCLCAGGGFPGAHHPFREIRGDKNKKQEEKRPFADYSDQVENSPNING